MIDIWIWFGPEPAPLMRICVPICSHISVDLALEIYGAGVAKRSHDNICAYATILRNIPVGESDLSVGGLVAQSHTDL